MVLKGKGMGGSKNVYTRIIYRVHERLHQSCYILFFLTISVRRTGFLLIHIICIKLIILPNETSLYQDNPSFLIQNLTLYHFKNPVNFTLKVLVNVESFWLLIFCLKLSKPCHCHWSNLQCIKE